MTDTTTIEADADAVEAVGLDPTGRDGDPRFPYSVADVEAERNARRCNWCGTAVAPHGSAWVGITESATCTRNPDGHEPEPTVRDFWQDGRNGTQYLDTTSTPKDSPVSMTVRMVLAPYLRNSEGRTITWEYVAYRTYHAAGTNVPELGPWLEVDRQQGWNSEATALTWAENKAEMIGEDWEPERDAEYAAKVEQVTAVQQAEAARDDRLVLDKIATLLATSPDWNGDQLTRIADLVGAVRPHPGDRDADEWARLFYDEMGRPVPETTTYG